MTSRRLESRFPLFPSPGREGSRGPSPRRYQKPGFFPRPCGNLVVLPWSNLLKPEASGVRPTEERRCSKPLSSPPDLVSSPPGPTPSSRGCTWERSPSPGPFLSWPSTPDLLRKGGRESRFFSPGPHPLNPLPSAVEEGAAAEGRTPSAGGEANWCNPPSSPKRLRRPKPPPLRKPRPGSRMKSGPAASFQALRDSVRVLEEGTARGAGRVPVGGEQAKGLWRVGPPPFPARSS